MVTSFLVILSMSALSKSENSLFFHNDSTLSLSSSYYHLSEIPSIGSSSYDTFLEADSWAALSLALFFPLSPLFASVILSNPTAVIMI